MKNKLIIGFGLILLAGFYSCQKNEGGSDESSLTANLYSAVSEMTGTQVGIITNCVEHGVADEPFDGRGPANLISGNLPGGFHMPGIGFPGMFPLKFGIPHVDSCATVSVSSGTFPKEIVVEYLAGCSTHRHDKRGKIIITLSDTITNTGAVQTIKYQDFFIDSLKVDFTATLKNLGKNSSGNWIIEKSYDQTLTKDDYVVRRKNSETEEWTAGFETADRSDNIYYLTGAGSIVINDTATYSRKIITPLLYDAGCDFIKSGVVELNRRGSIATIDYGDGTCDDTAAITTNGTTESITLHSGKFREGGKFDRHFHGFGKSRH
jgi:hypothetical protein